MMVPVVGRAMARVSRLSPVARLVAARSDAFRVLMARSGAMGSPKKMATDSVVSALSCALVTLPLAVALGALLTPLLFIVALAPVGVLLWPELALRDMAAKRKEGVERELPVFSMLADVLSEAGVPLYAVFDGVSDRRIFGAMSEEAKLVKRDVTIFGMNPNESFERLAGNHPSARFGEFLEGYTSKVRSGGDVASYLSGECASQLRELEEGWTRYAGRVALVGSMMVTLFGVLPLLLMVVGFFSPAFSITGLLIFTGVGVPLFTILLLRLVEGMQPVAEEPPEGKLVRSILVSLPGLALAPILGEAWVGAAAALVIFCAAYGLSVRAQLREVRDLEAGLIRFLKDLMELKRQEYDLTKGVGSIASTRNYGPAFNSLLAEAGAQLRAGVPLDELEVRSRSRLVRAAFFLVGEMSRSGGGTVDTVFHLTSYCAKIVETKRSAVAEMRPYTVLAYASPLMLAFGVTFVKSVLETFSKAVRPSFGTISISAFHIGSVPPALLQVSDVLIVVSAASLGLIGAKINDSTVRNTLPCSVNVAIAVFATLAMAAITGGAFARLGF